MKKICWLSSLCLSMIFTSLEAAADAGPHLCAALDPAHVHSTAAPESNEAEMHHRQPWITIFVHGTMGLGTTASLSTLPTLFKEKIKGTVYEKEMLRYRATPDSYRDQPMQGIGLKQIRTNCSSEIAAELFTCQYNTNQNLANPEQETIAYYTAGWSGIVNHQERYEAAGKLYDELFAEFNRLREFHPELKVRVIAYSHGANVVLNMAEIHQERGTPEHFKIHEFIMIGAPVQRETDCYIVDPFFEKKAYSICSRGDYVQKMDCFSTIRFFSDRYFRDSARCVIGDKLQQIELKVTIAADKDLKKKHSSKKRIDRSPGHIELWYFGWPGTNKYYRDYFPLHPLPTAVFIPQIIKAAQTCCPDARRVVVELQPDLGVAVVRNRHSKKDKKTIACVTCERLETMQKRTNHFYDMVIAPRPENHLEQKT